MIMFVMFDRSNLICDRKFTYACIHRTGSDENTEHASHLFSLIVWDHGYICLFVACVSVYHPILVTIYER